MPMSVQQMHSRALPGHPRMPLRPILVPPQFLLPPIPLRLFLKYRRSPRRQLLPRHLLLRQCSRLRSRHRHPSHSHGIVLLVLHRTGSKYQIVNQKISTLTTTSVRWERFPGLRHVLGQMPSLECLRPMVGPQEMLLR